MTEAVSIPVPQGWPCQFDMISRGSGFTPCKVCGRDLAHWSACPSVQAAADGRLWDEMHDSEPRRSHGTLPPQSVPKGGRTADTLPLPPWRCARCDCVVEFVPDQPCPYCGSLWVRPT